MMGSGKGRSRRSRSDKARGTQAPVLQGSLDWQKWSDFVNSSGLKNVSLYKYYIGKESEQCSDAEHEEMLSELITDAVTVGAVQLPSPYVPEDFVFKLEGTGSMGFRQARIMLRSQPKLILAGNGLQYYYVKRCRTLLHSNTNFVLGRIINGIDSLATAAKATP